MAQERLNSESQLAKHRRMLEQAQRIAAVGCWEWNIVTNDLEWTEEIYRIFGLKPWEFGASYPAFLERVHPSDRAAVELAVQAAIAGQASYDIRHRIVRPSGEIRVVREQGEVEFAPSGRALRMLGVVQDITEFHRIEEDLRTSEQRLSGVLQIAPEAIIVADEKGEITTFSIGAETIFGYMADEVVGSNVSLLVPERFRAKHDEHVRRFSKAPTSSMRMSERSEIVGLRKNGEEFPAQASISRLSTPRGPVFTTILRDVTSETAARRALFDAKERAVRSFEVANEAMLRLEEAQRLANIGSWEWRPDRNQLACSEQTLRILGRTAEEAEALREGLVCLAHADDLALVRQAFCTSYSTGVPLDIHHRIVRPNGEERFVHSRARVVFGSSGAVAKLTGVIHDLTEMRSMEELLQTVKEAGERARSESAAKTDFLSHMSHELRTPLNAIIGYSELMLEEARETARDGDVKDLERVISAASHLLKLINGLLDLSKIEAGKMDVEVSEFDVTDLLQSVIDTMRPVAAVRSNQLRLDTDAELGVACTDAFRLSQCLLNLLSNAAKFTEKGTIWLRARRDAGEDRCWLVLEVEDDGAGMSEEQLARLFKPFAQAESSTARTHGGTGLGLVITQELARLLGGDVAVRSAPGQGTVFTLRVLANLQQPEALNEEKSRQRTLRVATSR